MDYYNILYHYSANVTQLQTANEPLISAEQMHEWNQRLNVSEAFTADVIGFGHKKERLEVSGHFDSRSLQTINPAKNSEVIMDSDLNNRIRTITNST